MQKIQRAVGEAPQREARPIWHPLVSLVKLSKKNTTVTHGDHHGPLEDQAPLDSVVPDNIFSQNKAIKVRGDCGHETYELCLYTYSENQHGHGHQTLTPSF